MPLNLDHIEALARAGQAPDPSAILRLVAVARAAIVDALTGAP